MKNNRKIEVGQVRENSDVDGEYYVILSAGDSKCLIRTLNSCYDVKTEWDTSDIINDIVVM